jgi:uncharacterized membrane protein YagU involved in acid resistance
MEKPTDQMTQPRRTRKRALVGMIVSAVVMAPFVGLLVWASSKGYQIYGLGIGAPLVPLLYFLTEFIMGESFVSTARKWDQLKGWQRLVLGLAIVAMAVTIFALIGTVVSLIISGDFNRWIKSF